MPPNYNTSIQQDVHGARQQKIINASVVSTVIFLLRETGLSNLNWHLEK